MFRVLRETRSDYEAYGSAWCRIIAVSQGKIHEISRPRNARDPNSREYIIGIKDYIYLLSYICNKIR